VEWIELVTTENTNIDQKSVAAMAAEMSDVERACRIGGKPIRFSNLVHPLFTNTDSWWCFACHTEVLVVDGQCTNIPKDRSTVCGSREVTMYNHVEDFLIDHRWPAIFLLDPHPRKPHMMLWVTVDGNDDYSVVAELEVDDEPMMVKQAVDALEQRLHLQVGKRIGDRNMLLSSASSKRNLNWQDEFAAVGLQVDLAEPSDVGRARVNEYLKPDPRTRRPRLRFHETCQKAIHQVQRFSWDDHKHADEKEQKQLAKKQYDDYPALLRYLMNELPLCQTLLHGYEVVRPTGSMKRGY